MGFRFETTYGSVGFAYRAAIPLQWDIAFIAPAVTKKDKEKNESGDTVVRRIHHIRIEPMIKEWPPPRKVAHNVPTVLRIVG